MTRSEILSKANPILFNTEMVLAILSGQKTCTRRVVKPVGQQTHFWKPLHDRFIIEKVNDGWQIWLDQIGNPYTAAIPTCHPGDILYVRETWAKDQFGDGFIFPTEYSGAGQKWRPSIHMPKEAARIFLRVTDVRVERLQEITDDDIQREGVHDDPYTFAASEFYDRPELKDNYSKSQFAGLWNNTIKPADRERYGWDANPWVWVIEFERVEVDHD